MSTARTQDRALRVVLAFALLWFAFVSLGCKTIPEGRSSVNEVQIRGANKVDDDDTEDKIATTPSPKFLGLFRGILYEYSIFDRFVLQHDLARVEAFYRAKGYYNAHARAGRVHTIDEKHVRVEIIVEEGEPVLVRNVRVEGLEGLPESIAAPARRAAAEGLVRKEPFEEEAFERTEGSVRRAMSDRGYAYAKVESDAAVDIVNRTADVVFRVTPGPACTFGSVRFVGLGPLPEAPVRRAANIDEKGDFSQKKLEDAQQAMLNLGIFASVEVIPEMPKAADPTKKGEADAEEEGGEEEEPEEGTPEGGESAETPQPTVIPITVKLEPSRLRTLRLGGGIEFDALKSDVHALFGWEHKNFLGGMRTFSVRFRPGLVLYPLRVTNIVVPDKFLPEERLRFDFRQPGFPEARTNLFVRPEYNVTALLINPEPPPDARVIGYAEFRNAIGLDRTYWKLFGSISHNLQVAYPFAYVKDRDPTLGTVVISYPEISTELDFRDNRIHPRKGVWLGNTFQVAGGPFGGQADDVKIQPDIRGYIPLSKRIVVASRASFGLLYPRNYGDVVRRANREVTTPPPDSEERTRDFQLTFFRGFFSGGPTQNRGYPLRAVSPHDFVPFLTPELEAAKFEEECGQGLDCRSPTGGFTLWEASTEVRFTVTGPLSIATFCDASDVSPQTTDFRFDHLHLSCGAGGRYDTPVGPVRIDIGYRIPGMQVLGGLTRDEREPPDILGIPVALHLGIGEAY